MSYSMCHLTRVALCVSLYVHYLCGFCQCCSESMSVPPANQVMVEYHGTVTLMCIVNTIADASLLPNAAACIVKQHMHTQAQDMHTMNQI